MFVPFFKSSTHTTLRKCPMQAADALITSPPHFPVPFPSPQMADKGRAFMKSMTEAMSRNLYRALLNDAYAQVDRAAYLLYVWIFIQIWI